MTATTIARQTDQYGTSPDPESLVLPVLASTKLLAGTIVCDNGSGYAVAGATSTSLIAVGRAAKTVDNTSGANGAEKIKVERGAFWWANSEGGDELTIADRFSECYIVDNQTVAKTATGKSRGGIVLDVDANKGVLVLMGSALQATVSALESAKVTSVTLQVQHTDLTDADMTQTIDFAAALPANAVVLGREVRVATGFTDGAAGTFTADVGISGGDIDAIVDGVSLANVANLSGPDGVRTDGRFGAVTLAVTVIGSVNVDTASAGDVTVEVFYAVV